MAQSAPVNHPLSTSDRFAIAAVIVGLASPFVFVLLGLIAGAAAASLAAGLGIASLLASSVERAYLKHRADEAEAAAADLRATQDRLLFRLSHDLRQPVHAIALYAAALEKRVDNDEARSLVDKVDRAAQACGDLLGRFDTYARFSSETIEPDISDVALQHILERVVHAHPRISTPATELRVRTDPDLATEILLRLADNAERYGATGRIELHEREDSVEICIADNGPGLAATDQAQAFEAFNRLKAPSNEASTGPGLGLGLFIARRLARALGDDIRVASRPGEGARFSFSLPLAF